ncbi:MAG: hypothetical protein AAFW69_02460 [Pseudomonadota bacterium]
MIQDLWKIWRVITPRDGLMAIGAVMAASFVMHIVIMIVSEQYSAGLLG